METILSLSSDVNEGVERREPTVATGTARDSSETCEGNLWREEEEKKI